MNKAEKWHFYPIFSTDKTDKNGVEWWQGDLSRTGSGMVIELGHDGLCFRFKYDNDLFVVALPEMLSERVKIGNKFENPELLEA